MKAAPGKRSGQRVRRALGWRTFTNAMASDPSPSSWMAPDAKACRRSCRAWWRSSRACEGWQGVAQNQDGKRSAHTVSYLVEEGRRTLQAVHRRCRTLPSRPELAVSVGKQTARCTRTKQGGRRTRTCSLAVASSLPATDGSTPVSSLSSAASAVTGGAGAPALGATAVGDCKASSSAALWRRSSAILARLGSCAKALIAASMAANPTWPPLNEV